MELPIVMLEKSQGEEVERGDVLMHKQLVEPRAADKSLGLVEGPGKRCLGKLICGRALACTGQVELEKSEVDAQISKLRLGVRN
jgi:hypothetical protein